MRVNKPCRCFGEFETPSHFDCGLERNLRSTHEIGLLCSLAGGFLGITRLWQRARLEIALKGP